MLLAFIFQGHYRIIFAHPEALLSTNTGKEILKSYSLRANVVAIAIDEAHCVKD